MMIRRVTFFVAIVTFALFTAGFPRPSHALVMTGNALAGLCESKKERDLFACQSYIAGVVDYHVLIRSLGTAPSVDFCIPAKAKISDLALVFIDYIDRNPQHGSFVASPAVTLALYDIFPCSKKQGGVKR